MKAADPAAVRKNRIFLVLIALVFAAPMIAAGLLGWAGWMPGTASNGEAIVPQRNFVTERLQVQLADGKPYAWRDSEPRLTLVALAGPDCAAQCLATLTSMSP
jgi:cytochrome oxidase Cu insertion factor (SCO1/SenC/PrrC family)